MSAGMQRDDTTAAMDRDANLFAMHLLIPEEFLAPELKKLQGDIENGDWVRVLAKKFAVSETLMAARLAERRAA